MQAQISRTDQTQATLTSQQSLQSIQTLLKAGLGCITYLRNLLPVDNFSESYLTSSGPESLSSQPSIGSNSSFVSDNGQRNVSGFKVMTVTRGFTEEADKLLDLLENGIFDALQKQYLRSFIIAIYLDNEDPNNIVEAYTFNFNYYKIPGTDITVPVMSLDADLQKLSLSGTKQSHDPVADATTKGRVPTLGEVKRSLKALIKNLIQATTQMDPLPKRRYATFKLFYYDHTPDDYEPPHFRPGDSKKDKWFFTTHDRNEVPERCSVGSLRTGYHAVDVRVTSVSGYLPSAEDNNAPFLGTTAGHIHAAPTLTPVEEAAMRLQQVQIQREDALERRVAWDADDGLCDGDAEGEEDPDYAQDMTAMIGSDDSNGSISLGSWRIHDSGVEFFSPIGVRDDEGQVIPFSKEEKQLNSDDGSRKKEAQYAGKQDNVPERIAQLARGRQHHSADVLQTQLLEHTQVIESPINPPSPLTSPSPSPSPTPQPKSRKSKTRRIMSPENSLPPSDIIPSATSSLDVATESIDTQMVQDLIINACVGGEDSEMLDMDTQIVPPSVEDSIHSFFSYNQSDNQIAPGVGTDNMPDQGQDCMPSEGTLDCECGVALEDCDSYMCDGGCKRWFHMWCMGYHSIKDKRIPRPFICFDCRVKADENWDLIVVHDLYPRMIARFKDLAIFRRAIKLYETRKPEGLSAFTKIIGCDSVVAGQQFKRLEAEGFITSETKETDDFGLETTVRGKRGKTKGKAGAKTRQSQRLKPLQKVRHVFVQASTTGQAYQDYFNPDPEVEKRVLGLSDLKPRRKSHKVAQEVDVDMVQNEAPADTSAKEVAEDVLQGDVTSQTQQETQLPQAVASHGHIQPNGASELKRKSSKNAGQLMTRPSKKIKISVGPAVDLGD